MQVQQYIWLWLLLYSTLLDLLRFADDGDPVQHFVHYVLESAIESFKASSFTVYRRWWTDDVYRVFSEFL